MTSGIRLVDDVKGRVEEVLINYCPEGFEFTSGLIEALPSAKFYIVHGPTQEDLESKLMGYRNWETFGVDRFRKFYDVSLVEPKLFQIFQLNPSDVFRFIKNYKLGIGKRDRKFTALFGGDAAKSQEQIKLFERVYRSYAQDEKVREFIHTLIFFKASQYFDGSMKKLRKLKEKDQARVSLIPFGKTINAYSRDRILAGRNESGKLLVQGKVVSNLPPSLSWETKNNELGIVDLDFWKGKFQIVHNNQIGLMSYEGGDLRACEDLLFVNPNLFKENNEKGLSSEKTVDELEKISGRKIAIVGGECHPYMHLDMYFSPVDRRTVVLADLNPAIKVLSEKKKLLPGHLVAQERCQPYFDRISRVFGENGFDVRRVPAYFWQSPIDLSRVQISMTNDIRDGRTEILGSSGVKEIDMEAKDAYEELGFNVKLLKFANTFETMNENVRTHFTDSGARCVANVLSRSD